MPKTKFQNLPVPNVGHPVLEDFNDFEKSLFLESMKACIHAMHASKPLQLSKNSEQLFRSYAQSSLFLAGIIVDEHRKLVDALENDPLPPLKHRESDAMEDPTENDSQASKSSGGRNSNQNSRNKNKK